MHAIRSTGEAADDGTGTDRYMSGLNDTDRFPHLAHVSVDRHCP